MAALFGAGHPVTAVGDPDQNIYAWRGASLYNLFRFPQEFPKARRHAGDAAAAVHELPLRGAHPGGGRRGDRRRARGTAAAGQAARPVRAQRAGRGAHRAGARRVDRGPADRRPVRRPARRRLRVVRDGGAVPHVEAVHAAAPGLRRARGAGRDRGARRAVAHARGGRGVGVRPRGAGPDRQRGAGAHPARRALPGRLQGHRLARAPGDREDQEPARRLRAGGRRHREPAGAVGRGARAPRGGRGAVRGGPRAAGGVPRRAAGAPRRGAAAGRRVPGRGDPAHRHPRRAGRRPRPAARHGRAAQPRGVPRRGPRVPAGRRRAHAARVPRLRRRGGAARQAGVGAGAAHRRRLGQGHDDPRGQGPGVRPRVRAGLRARAPAEPEGPAEPGRARQVAGLRAAGRRRHPAALRGQPLGVPRRAEGAGDHRGTADRLRRAHPRAQDARRQRLLLVRRQHLPQEGKPVPERADGLGRRQRARGRRGRRHRAGRGQPDARAARTVRARLAGTGAPPGGRSAVPAGLAPGGTRPRASRPV